MIKRKITSRLLQLAGLYPVVTLTGPRQSGKTTLVKHTFPEYTYRTLEDPDTLTNAKNDPRGFLKGYKNGLIIDEAQRVPDLFSYIQGIVDNTNKPGQFILTGSQNFLLLESISQTLAGRVAILKLLPLSLDELSNGKFYKQNFEKLIFKGLYPRLYSTKIVPRDFYSFYIQTYVERDVKLIRNITNQTTFVRFIRMCAGRTGQLLNITDLANSCGITQITAKSWLSILEASYIIYFLQPYHKNFNKRLVKMPKLYFYDTGLVCSLLGIKKETQLETHFAYGALFENFMINEFIKHTFNNVEEPNYFFWRDKHGKEVDLIIEMVNKEIPIEIKAGRTFSYDFFKNIKYWNKLSGNKPENSYVIFGGENDFNTSEGNVLSWKNIKLILNQI